MVDKLAATGFLAVLGSSGSGKSSLVNCGLLPALRRGLMARAGTSWRIVDCTPKNDPTGRLTQALAKSDVLASQFESKVLSFDQIVRATLDNSRRGLIEVFEQSRPTTDTNLLVFVDQFEELFRYAREESSSRQESVAFVNLLLEVLNERRHMRQDPGAFGEDHPSARIYVVLTMRSDFLGDCARFPGLPSAVSEGQYLVPRMTRSERRAAISGPAQVRGPQIAPILLTRLVNDVGDDPDQLSILQHALRRTWDDWVVGGASKSISLGNYENIGTMEGALDQHAREAFEKRLNPGQRIICERLFKAITDKASDPRGIRRPTESHELIDIVRTDEGEFTEDEIAEVIDVFRDPAYSFLTPLKPEVLQKNSPIDISHESLMRVWGQLRKWADAEAESSRKFRRLAETAALYSQVDSQTGERGAALLRDPDLQLALVWYDENKPTPACGECQQV
jgi:hypothetical protein